MEQEKPLKACNCCEPCCDSGYNTGEARVINEPPQLVNPEAVEYWQKNSNLIKWAKFELDIAGYTEYSKDERKMFRDDLLELLTVISAQGHSGGSISHLLAMFNRLVQFKPLTPLTFADNEWNLIGGFNDDKGPVYQNRRCSSIFKDKEGIHDIDCFVKKEVLVKRFDGTEEDRSKNPMCWSGSLRETKDGVYTGRWFCKVNIKDPSKEYTPGTKYYIPCTGVEVGPDDWEMYAEADEIAKIEESGIFEIQWRTDDM